MASNADDGADEVKVFRRSDGDDVETAQSTHQLTEDKKEVALEAELESKNSPSFIAPKSGAFIKPSPSYYPLAQLSPNFASVPFFPFFMPGSNPYAMPMRLQAPVNPAASLSPSYAALYMQQMQQAALSPSFLTFPPSTSQLPFCNPTNASKGCNPLSGLMRNMAASAPHPLSSVNPMRLNQMSTPLTSMVSNLTQAADGATSSKRSKAENMLERERHIKKPLNAFMWFMKKNRPKLMEELDYKERQSAELNKELGRRWHNLSKEEQQQYYDMAKEDRKKHMEKYPNWSARENYAINKKKKRKNRDRVDENGEHKKCRARFGLAQQDKWCKHCKRKKRCLWYREDREVASPMAPVVSSTTPGTPGTPSLSGPTIGGMSGRDSDSESDVESDDPNAAQMLLEQTAPEQVPPGFIC
uniref:dTCF n=1 Tax=Syphacia muris TaxID=451379 RepID=A0A0N5APQ9_9BILA